MIGTRRALAAWLVLLAFALPAAAEEAADAPADAPPADATDAAEVEALADQIEARVNALRAAGQERDEAIEFLTRQVEQAIGNLTTTQEKNADLQQTNADLNWQIESLVEARAALSEELSRTSEAHDQSVDTLEAQVADLTQLLESEQDEKADLIAERDALAAQLAAIDEERAALDRALAEAEKTASTRKEAIVAREEEIERLGAELAALRGELESITGRLTDSQEEIDRKEKDLAELKKRLNLALASQVEELSQFRSEFFGRLRKAIGDHPDMRVEGDRFVFQSEVLFETGSAELGAAGKQQLVRLARTLKEIAAGIPDDLRWVLRVDGHTDRRAINTANYPSNWELSAARALTVVHFLVEQGIPPHRLAATGFGQYQPIDPANDEIAYRRNRRIEFKLTQR